MQKLGKIPLPLEKDKSSLRVSMLRKTKNSNKKEASLVALFENSFELDALETTSIKHSIKFKYHDL